MNRGEAIGLIEAIGLATAIEAADAAVKSANVRLIGYEACKGDGMSTIKVAGDIGAVKAAVDAATAACAKGRGVWATKVIARPSEGIEKLIYNSQTVGYTPPVEPEAEVVVEESKAEANEAVVAETTEEFTEEVTEEVTEEATEEATEE
ncbi:BMC domain-containing protein [uncultured Acetobacterium sp.]|uniref:BMC domain-containing protein n=1 Tax=uncultured Acetobacterium sp. TaxID=217139 RepID=UPI0025D283D4|nr:BMC domain-containing protein [uncultured Acetobacterium sp.]